VILQHVMLALISVIFVMTVRLNGVLTMPQQLFVEQVITQLSPEATVPVLQDTVVLIWTQNVKPVIQVVMYVPMEVMVIMTHAQLALVVITT
jgi:hypothetical protein